MRNARLVVLLIVSWTALSARAGWEYTAVTKAEGGRQSEMMGNSIKALVEGSQARVEFVESGNPMMRAGSYLLIQDAGKSMVMVNPQEKTYTTWDMNSMMGMAGGVMGMLNMEVQNPKVEKLLEENGGPLLGYPTTHYRFRTSYSMSMSFMGMKHSTATVQEEDLWAAATLKDAAFSLQAMQNNMKTGNEQLDKLITAQKNKAEGFPLKMISTHTVKDARGQDQVVKTTMEVTALKAARPAADQFKVPAGYQEGRMLLPFGGGKKGAGGKQNGGEPDFKNLLEQIQKAAQ
ncbi:MAG: DUF4412 domain-containing protein [Kiritimatiellaeota bacterium]|nr:DUF4412 domain-containing protein [Kiritimatiellota bacterium]